MTEKNTNGHGERLSRKDVRELFIAQAEKYLGYTSRADGTSTFGETVGYAGNGLPWDGAFIDVVAREAGLRWKSHVYTPQALSNYITDGRIFRKPQRGDIVFFETPTVGQFGAPHIGIVTDVRNYLTDGTFSTIEAQVSSGLPKGSTLNDGVYRRMRSSLEVMTYARPDFNLTVDVDKHEVTQDLPTVKPAHVKPGMRHPNVELLQMALAVVTGVRKLPRGHFDSKTRSAYAKFQRSIGILGADGVPEISSLQRLAKETNLFRAQL